MPDEKPTNDQIADVLDRIADLLEVAGANRFRLGAYRDAAHTVRGAGQSIADTAQEEGQEGLKELPNIGQGIASVITAYVRTGRSDLLERLKGQVAPGELFTQVPGIGQKLARRIAEELDISTLEELELAAHDGRLEEVEGFGKTRVRNVRMSLAGMLSTAAQRRRRHPGGDERPHEEPSAETLLEVDQEYRRKAEAGQLRKIAPKRFNPEREAWLPMLNTERKGWQFTALYSNTARAHELDKTDDWVVLYFERDGEEGQATVVTETRGPLEGKRVVRGREAECRPFYEQQGSG
jgi:DNA polymerase (family 10)